MTGTSTTMPARFRAASARRVLRRPVTTMIAACLLVGGVPATAASAAAVAADTKPTGKSSVAPRSQRRAPVPPTVSAVRRAPLPAPGRDWPSRFTTPQGTSVAKGESFTPYSRTVINGTDAVTEVHAQETFAHDRLGWHRLDNRVTSQAGGLTQSELTRPVGFPDTRVGLTVSLDGGPVTLTALGSAPVRPSLQTDGQVLYRAAWTDTDVRYVPSGDGVREEIVLQSARAPHSVRFHLSDPHGQLGQVQPRPDGSYVFSRPVDATSGARLVLAPATAYTLSTPDQPGVGGATGTAHMTVTPSGDGFDITKTVDATWLKGKSFPVVLDPTVTFQTSTQARDCAMYSGAYATSSYCSLGYLQVGGVNGGNPTVSNGYVQRSVIRFDLSSIPTSAKVLDANMYLQAYYATATTTAYPQNVHLLSRGFTQSATWNTYDGTHPWTAAGGDFTSTVQTTTSSLAAKPAYTRFGPVTAATQGWVTNPNANYGLLLKQGTENVSQKYTYYATASATGSQPYLTVHYTVPATAPTSVTANPTDGGANVAWQPATVPANDPDSYITSYVLNAYAAGTTTPVVATDTVKCRSAGAGNPPSCPLSDLLRGLTNGAPYYVTVAAINQAGTGPAASSNQFTPTPQAAFTGLEKWWSYTRFNTGPTSQASVNASNGNLVLQQLDSSTVQGHGRLSYTLRRTYNSLDAPIATLPGSIGAGWTLNVGELGEGLTGSDTSIALSTPGADSVTQAQNLTLSDRDGTRHVFTPKATGTTRPTINVISGTGTAVPVALGALVPRVLQLDTTKYTNLCLDTAYRAPPGVHLSVWRYIEVNSTGASNPCTAGPNTTAPVVLGFVATRPDRLRSEYAFDGRLLNQLDGAGNDLRYLYETSVPGAGVELGRLTAVYEPRCATSKGVTVTSAATIPPTCRALRFSYSAATATPPTTAVKDPAGRVTTYEFDTQAPGATSHLLRVVNPDGSTEVYTYSGVNGAASCGAAGALCSAKDPNATATLFAYGTGPAGTAVSSVTDRRGTATAFAYPSATSSTSTRNGYEIRTFSGIDARGRVGTVQDSAGGALLHDTRTTWDTTGATCRQPDPAVDNNACSVRRVQTGTAANAAPDQATSYTYNNDGYQLVQRSTVHRTSGETTTNPDDTATDGYHVQQLGLDGTVRTYDDTPAGGGAVNDAPRQDAVSPTLYTIDDHTSTVPSRGNAAGSGFARYQTTWTVDNNATAAPNSNQPNGFCSTSGTATANSGLTCEQDAAGSDTNTVSADTHHDPTRNTYDTYGQRVTMTTAKALAAAGTGTAQSYRYFYYADTDMDLSGNVSAGGWLLGVADPTATPATTAPTSRFVAYAYDRAGNRTRTWDRNATTRNAVAITAYTAPLTATAPPGYAQQLRATGTEAAAVANPWRYLRSSTTPLHDTTTMTVDSNGNVLTLRSPRGNRDTSRNYDTVTTFTPDDLAKSVKAPGSEPASTTTYDAYGNHTIETDARGQARKIAYDGLNRPTIVSWTRSAYAPNRARTAPDGTSFDPDCNPGTQTGANDPTFPAGRILCQSSTSYDGQDNLVQAVDSSGATIDTSYDSEGRKTKTIAQRTSTSTSRTELLYDPDGNVTDVCSPREFDPSDGNSSTCTGTGYYTAHTDYDPAGRATRTNRWRVPSGTASSNTNANRTALVTTHGYDADGNPVSTTDPNANATGSNYSTTTSFDVLDRPTTTTTPRDATNSNTTTWTYDPAGDRLSQTRPGNLISAFSYDADLRPVDSVTGASSTDAATSGVVSADGGSNTRTRRYYDADGHVVATLPPRAFQTSVTSPDLTYMTSVDYDTEGRASAVYKPRYDAATSDPALEPAQARDCSTSRRPAAVVGDPAETPAAYPSTSNTALCATRVTYDGEGNITQLTLPTSTGSDNRYIAYGYSDDNLRTTLDTPSSAPGGTQGVSTGPNGPRTISTTVYDGHSKPLTVTDPLGHVSSNTYNPDGTAITSTDPLNHTSTYYYNAAGAPVSTVNALGEGTKTVINSDGTVADNIDGAGDDTSYGYDANGNHTAVRSPEAVAAGPTNPSGTPTTSTFSRDNLLLTTSTPISGDGKYQRTRTNTYDSASRMTDTATATVDNRQTPAVTSATSSLKTAYYPDDLVATRTGRDGNTITSTYNPDGQPTKTVDSTGAGSTLTASYYLDGLLRDMTDGTGTDARTTVFSYDGAGSRTARRDSPAGSATGTVTAYTYNDSEQPASVTDPDMGTGSTQYTAYDAASRLLTMTLPNGTVVNRSYNNDDTLGSQTSNAGPGGTTLAAWNYTYDALRRITGQTTTGATAPNGSTGAAPGTADNRDYAYGYDAAGRVNSFTAGTTSKPITHDHDGNRLSYDGTTYSYNADDTIASSTQNLVTSGYTYTTNGAVKTDECNTNHYDGFDRLDTMTGGLSVGCATPGTTTYTYDGMDRQRSHVATNPIGSLPANTTVQVHYDGASSTVSSEKRSDQTTPAAYELDGKGTTLGVAGPAATDRQFLIDDGHGNITTGIAADDTVNCTARFDPFGNPSQTRPNADDPCNTGSSTGDVFYGGGRRDQTSGNYQNGARTYDPGKASFLTADTAGANGSAAAESLGTDPLTRNGYSYVNGDPVNNTDPTGHMALRDGGGGAPCANSKCEQDNEAAYKADQQRARDADQQRTRDAQREQERLQKQHSHGSLYNTLAGSGLDVVQAVENVSSFTPPGMILGLVGLNHTASDWLREKQVNEWGVDTAGTSYAIGYWGTEFFQLAIPIGAGAKALGVGARIVDKVGVSVAAEDGAGDTLRHYTTKEFGDQITKDGVINVGGSGKTWLTPDEYTDGLTARSKLALNKTPDGYFEIPRGRISEPSAPGPVQPWDGQPGGGTEITTGFPIDVGGLPFNLFEASP